MSQRISRVLVAVDGSVRAPGVLSVATDVVESMRATMQILRVISIPPEFPAAANNGNRPDTLPAFLEREAVEGMQKLVDAEPRARSSRLIVRRGAQPWRAILEVADETDADLIVLGSHGYGGLDRILGTTAGKVSNMAHCNVLVVHGARIDTADAVRRRHRVPSSRSGPSSRPSSRSGPSSRSHPDSAPSSRSARSSRRPKT